MSGKHFAADLRRLGACVEAIEWALEQPDAASAWAACERPDWLLWLAGRTATTEEHRKAIVLAGCACARTALKYIPEGEDRPRVAIETAEAWARGEATIAQVRAARDGAWAARGEFWRKWIDAAAAADAVAYAADDAAYADAAYADAAYADAAAAYAADAAAYADAAADAVAYAADAVAYVAADDAVAYAAAYAADAAAYAARAKARREMADIVRQHITMPVVGVGT